MNEENLTIALLIDTDNVSAAYMSDLEQKLIALGKVTYRRMYGDFTRDQSKGWRELVNDFSLIPVQQYTYTSGKNATDSRMVIDAMDILYSGNVNAMCIMSSDSDFTGLAKRLKESNIFVIGAGEKKTPQSFVKACDRFFLMGEADGAETEERKSASKKPKKTTSDPDKREAETEKKERRLKADGAEEKTKTVAKVPKSAIERTVANLLAQKNGACSLEWVATKIYQAYPQFDFRDYGVKKSYEFFDKRKFELVQVSNSNWTIALK